MLAFFNFFGNSQVPPDWNEVAKPSSNPSDETKEEIMNGSHSTSHNDPTRLSIKTQKFFGVDANMNDRTPSPRLVKRHGRVRSEIIRKKPSRLVVPIARPAHNSCPSTPMAYPNSSAGSRIPFGAQKLLGLTRTRARSRSVCSDDRRVELADESNTVSTHISTKTQKFFGVDANMNDRSPAYKLVKRHGRVRSEIIHRTTNAHAAPRHHSDPPTPHHHSDPPTPTARPEMPWEAQKVLGTRHRARSRSLGSDETKESVSWLQIVAESHGTSRDDETPGLSIKIQKSFGVDATTKGLYRAGGVTRHGRVQSEIIRRVDRPPISPSRNGHKSCPPTPRSKSSRLRSVKQLKLQKVLDVFSKRSKARPRSRASDEMKTEPVEKSHNTSPDDSHSASPNEPALEMSLKEYLNVLPADDVTKRHCRVQSEPARLARPPVKPPRMRHTSCPSTPHPNSFVGSELQFKPEKVPSKAQKMLGVTTIQSSARPRCLDPGETKEEMEGESHNALFDGPAPENSKMSSKAQKVLGFATVRSRARSRSLDSDPPLPQVQEIPENRFLPPGKRPGKTLQFFGVDENMKDLKGSRARSRSFTDGESLSDDEFDPSQVIIKDLDTGRQYSIEDLERKTERCDEKSSPSPKSNMIYSTIPSRSSAPLPSRTHLQTVALSKPRRILVDDLQKGDILLVRGTNAVAVSQTITQIFSSDTTKTGDSRTIHAMLVVDRTMHHAHVAHVTKTGGVLNYIRDLSDLESFEAIAYRLDSSVPSMKFIARTVCRFAKRLCEAKKICFDTAGSIQSVFKDPQFHHYLRNSDSSALRIDALANQRKSDQDKSADIFSDPWGTIDADCPETPMFCSEFVIKCFQRAFAEVSIKDDQLVRLLDLDGGATTPMCLEGYLIDNVVTYQDWKRVGLVQYQLL